MAGETLSAKLGLDTASFNKPLKEASDLWVAEQKKIAQAAQAAAAQVDAASKKQASSAGQSVGQLKEGVSKLGSILSGNIGAAFGGSIIANIALDAAKAWQESRKLHGEMASILAMPATKNAGLEALTENLQQAQAAMAKLQEQQSDPGSAMKTFLVDKSLNLLSRIRHPFDKSQQTNLDTAGDLENDRLEAQQKARELSEQRAAKAKERAQSQYDTGFEFNEGAERAAAERAYKEAKAAAISSEGSGKDDLVAAADIEYQRKQEEINRKVNEMRAGSRNALGGAQEQKTEMTNSAQQSELDAAARKKAEAIRQAEAKYGQGQILDEQKQAAELTYQNETAAIEKKYKIEAEELALQRETAVLKGTAAQNSIASLQKEIAMLERRLKTEKNLNDEEKDRINTQLTAAKAGLRTAGISRAGEQEATSNSLIDAGTTVAYASQLEAVQGKLKNAVEYQKKLKELQADEATMASAAARVNDLQKQAAEMQRVHDLELADAKTQTAMMQAQQQHQPLLMQMLNIELQYQDKIAAALKAKNAELVTQLTHQRQLAILDAGLPEFRKTPQQRLDESRQRRKDDRDRDRMLKEGAQAAQDEAQGIRIDPNSRRAQSLKVYRELQKKPKGAGAFDPAQFSQDLFTKLDAIANNIGINK